jgi:tetratricopeptide (TPR) repeat protein
MERLLALDPEYHVVYSHLAFAYAQLGEFAKAYERLDAWESKEPVIVRDTRAVVSAFEGQLDESLRWSEQSEGHGIFTRSVFCLAAGRWDLAESIVRTHGSRTDDLGWILRLTRAYLHVYRGELGKAETAFRQFLPAQLEQDQATLGGLWASTLASLAELSSLKADHRAARREAERALTVQPQGPFSLYFAGLYATRAGEIPTGERHLQTLEKVLSVARGPLVPHYRDALAAEIALARGRASEARPLLENAIGSGKLFYDAMTYSPAPAFREGLARTYLAIGDNEKAAEALQALVSNRWEGFSDPVRCVRALYTLGKLRLELGDRARGRELLEKFLKHWGNADWDIPEVRSARALLAASTSPQ